MKFVSHGYVFGDADIVTKGKNYSFTLKSATAGGVVFRIRAKNYLDLLSHFKESYYKLKKQCQVKQRNLVKNVARNVFNRWRKKMANKNLSMINDEISDEEPEPYVTSPKSQKSMGTAGSAGSPKFNSQFIDGGGSSTLEDLIPGLNTTLTNQSLNKANILPPASTQNRTHQFVMNGHDYAAGRTTSHARKP